MTYATPKPRAGEHTKGPWAISTVASIWYVHHANQPHAQVARCYKGKEDARRIVACVNACEGIVGELPNMLGLLDTIKRIITERDSLREALIEAQRRLNDAKLKGRGNDFYAAIVAVEQDLRTSLAKHGR